MTEDSKRQQALQLLREQRVDEAIEILSRLVQSNLNDAESIGMLGLAYSRKGLHPQAIRALRTAAELAPGNPQYAYHLGQAQERSGELQPAAATYADLLRAHPQHAPARARLQTLGAAGASSLAQLDAARAAEQTAASAPQQEMTLSYAQAAAAPPQEMTLGYAQAAAAPTLGPLPLGPAQLPPAGALAGAGGPQFLGPPPSASPQAAPALPPQDHYPLDTNLDDEIPEDTFSPLQAWLDWCAILLTPRKFFRTQQLAGGLRSPFMFLLLMALLSTPGLLMQDARQNRWPVPGSAPLSALFHLGAEPIILMISTLIIGLVLTLVASWFNGTGTYIQSCRILIYANGAPMPIVHLIAGLVMMGLQGPPAQGAGATPRTEVRLASAQLPPGALQQELQPPGQQPFTPDTLQQMRPPDPAIQQRMEELQQEMETNPARRSAAFSEFLELQRKQQQHQFPGMPPTKEEKALDELSAEAAKLEKERARQERYAAAPSSRAQQGAELIMLLWTVVLTGIGIANVHEMETWDAVRTMWVTGVFMAVIDCFIGLAAVSHIAGSL